MVTTYLSLSSNNTTQNEIQISWGTPLLLPALNPSRTVSKGAAVYKQEDNARELLLQENLKQFLHATITM